MVQRGLFKDVIPTGSINYVRLTSCSGIQVSNQQGITLGLVMVDLYLEIVKKVFVKIW